MRYNEAKIGVFGCNPSRLLRVKFVITRSGLTVCVSIAVSCLVSKALCRTCAEQQSSKWTYIQLQCKVLSCRHGSKDLKAGRGSTDPHCEGGQRYEFNEIPSLVRSICLWANLAFSESTCGLEFTCRWMSALNDLYFCVCICRMTISEETKILVSTIQWLTRPRTPTSIIQLHW
jgi:hypothetical protein